MTSHQKKILENLKFEIERIKLETEFMLAKERYSTLARAIANQRRNQTVPPEPPTSPTEPEPPTSPTSPTKPESIKKPADPATEPWRYVAKDLAVAIESWNRAQAEQKSAAAAFESARRARIAERDKSKKLQLKAIENQALTVVMETQRKLDEANRVRKEKYREYEQSKQLVE